MKVDQETKKPKPKVWKSKLKTDSYTHICQEFRAFSGLSFVPTTFKGKKDNTVKDEKMEEYFGNRSPLSFLIPGLVWKLWM